MYQETILNYEREDIQEVTLLSIEEYEKYQYFVPKTLSWWWLRSPGYDFFHTVIIQDDGFISNYGNCVDDDYIAVRPAFYCNTYDVYIGTKVFVGKISCTVIDHGLVLADYSIELKRFDSDSNNWENSELCHYLNSDEFFNKIGV